MISLLAWLLREKLAVMTLKEAGSMTGWWVRGSGITNVAGWEVREPLSKIDLRSTATSQLLAYPSDRKVETARHLSGFVPFAVLVEHGQQKLDFLTR